MQLTTTADRLVHATVASIDSSAQEKAKKLLKFLYQSREYILQTNDTLGALEAFDESARQVCDIADEIDETAKEVKSWKIEPVPVVLSTQ